jgi:5-formyltetrahydrofolate cyclo-ligase
MLKKDLRKQYLQTRKNLDNDLVNQLSQEICNNFWHFIQNNIKNYQQKVFALYLPINNEVSTILLQKYFSCNAIKYCLPKITGDSLQFYTNFNKMTNNQNFIKIIEPQSGDLCSPDIIVVPLVAFDNNCNRIGMGKGFYDRALSNYNSLNIGIAFNCQYYNNIIDAEKHDRKLDFIITESKIFFSSIAE